MSDPGSKPRPSGWYGSRATRKQITPEQNRGMSDAAWIISSRLIAGLLLYAGIGWLLSRWFGHADVFIAVGALFGLGLSFFLVFRQLPMYDGTGRHKQDDDQENTK